MRDSAEIRAAAVATGYFDGPWVQYVGDGYTVPWQVAIRDSLPLGLGFAAYKVYLDNLDIEPSRLHDWCYTPYGSLINVTREEADAALRDELAVSSTIDAAIVYAAVRIGGGPYFGTSATGFVGWVKQPSQPNIPNAPRSKPVVLRRSSGMSVKCVMLFQLVTKAVGSQPSVGYAARDHIAGWSESMYSGQDLAGAQAQMFGGGSVGAPVCPARAALLPTSASIVGVRFYQGSGRGVLVQRGFPGSAGECDYPATALLIRANDPTVGRSIRITLRGIPDDVVENGEYKPVAPFDSNLALYLNSALQGMGYKTNTRTDETQVVSIDATGVVKTAGAVNPLWLGKQVTIRGGKTASGANFTGATQKVAAVGVNQFTFDFWGPVGNSFGTVQGGAAFVKGTALGSLSQPGQEPTVVRLSMRKVGRPFEQYRGRRSKKRKTA